MDCTRKEADHELGREPASPGLSWPYVLALSSCLGIPQWWTVTCPNKQSTVTGTKLKHQLGHLLMECLCGDRNRLAGQRVPRIPLSLCLCPHPSVEATDMCHTWPFMGAVDLNPGPRACTVSTSPKNHLPTPRVCAF